MTDVMHFWRGTQIYHIAQAREGDGFIGLCNGRVIGKAPDRPSLMRMILMTSVWRSAGAATPSTDLAS